MNSVSVDFVVEVDAGHVMYLEAVVVVGVLVGPRFSPDGVVVDSGNDIDMIVTDEGQGGGFGIEDFFVVVKFGQDCLGVLLFNVSHVLNIPEEEVVYMVGHVHARNHVLYP